jgi:hypothetical protein
MTMTWHIPLAVTRQGEDEDEDEALQTNAKTPRRGVAWLLADMGSRVGRVQEMRSIARAV